MAIVVTAEVPGGTAEQDDSIVERLDLAGNPPPGSLARVAGPAEGGWRIISVWESREAFEAFRRDRLEPALREVGRPSPNFTFWEVHSVRFPGRGRG
jgi:hypothetical protein